MDTDEPTGQLSAGDAMARIEHVVRKLIEDTARIIIDNDTNKTDQIEPTLQAKINGDVNELCKSALKDIHIELGKAPLLLSTDDGTSTAPKGNDKRSVEGGSTSGPASCSKRARLSSPPSQDGPAPQLAAAVTLPIPGEMYIHVQSSEAAVLVVVLPYHLGLGFPSLISKEDATLLSPGACSGPRMNRVWINDTLARHIGWNLSADDGGKEKPRQVPVVLLKGGLEFGWVLLDSLVPFKEDSPLLHRVADMTTALQQYDMIRTYDNFSAIENAADSRIEKTGLDALPGPLEPASASNNSLFSAIDIYDPELLRCMTNINGPNLLDKSVLFTAAGQSMPVENRDSAAQQNDSAATDTFTSRLPELSPRVPAVPATPATYMGSPTAAVTPKVSDSPPSSPGSMFVDQFLDGRATATAGAAQPDPAGPEFFIVAYWRDNKRIWSGTGAGLCKRLVANANTGIVEARTIEAEDGAHAGPSYDIAAGKSPNKKGGNDRIVLDPRALARMGLGLSGQSNTRVVTLYPASSRLPPHRLMFKTRRSSTSVKVASVQAREFCAWVQSVNPAILIDDVGASSPSKPAGDATVVID